MIVYSDFECPFCAKFAREIWPTIKDRYVRNGELVVAFRHLPIESRHPRALKAAEAAECAGLQNKFWEMHDLLFAAQSALEVSHLFAHARSLALNMSTFEACMKGSRTAKIRAEAAAGRNLGASGTPAFFVGRRLDNGQVRIHGRVAGIRSVADFHRILDGLLQSE